MITIRSEKPADHGAVREVNQQAFGSSTEAALVDALRAAADPIISLVAVDNDHVVGHILFSPVTIEDDDSALAMGLAPMAVLPNYQRRGVGSQLVRAGLTECHRIGRRVVVVLGHPRYYPRFGFIPASRKALHCEYPVPDEVFMVLELEPGALEGRHGLVKYRPEFAAI